jgi:hypothetical protein
MNILRKLTRQYTKTFSNSSSSSKRKKTKTSSNRSNKHTIKNKQFNKLNCSPLSPNKNTNTNTCYNEEMIDELVDNWNKKHTNNNKINKNSDMNTKYNQLSNKLSDKCVNERCWAKTLIKKDVNKYLEVFAPYSPTSWLKNPTEWLSSIEIQKTLKQYEKCDKTFKFIGPTPIDFDTVIGNVCVTPLLCKFTLSTYIKNGIKKIAIIFNTDKHDESGSHWIALYINITNQIIFFFDSAGNPCPTPIEKLVKRIITQGKQMNIQLKFDQNYPMVHQAGHTECGMYCLFFIINMVKDTLPIHYFKKKRIPDEYMIKYRSIIFNKAS